ncbi:MAG: baseplate J/gp47 family protein [Sinobacteraceae bacterium]|nr:baseplate J/gp47 family protein [Nevskiaceae bacterium]
MPVSSPPLSTLNARLLAEIAARVEGATPQLRRSILGAIATALAGALHGLYGYVSQLAVRGVPSTATGPALDGWASLWGLARAPAAAASGSIVITGQAGLLVPAGSQLQSLVGVEYALDADATIGPGGTVTASVTALLAQADGNQSPGAILSFISPLSGVDPTATVASGGLTGGADIETDDALRARLIDYLSNAPQGGSQADYVRWALSVTGVSRAWCMPLYSGIGTVRVYIADDSYVGATLASPALVSAVQAYIDSIKPVGVAYVDAGGNVQNGLEVVAPTAQPVDITATVAPDTTDIRAAVTANLKDLFAAASPEGTIKLHQIYKAFLDAPGLTDFTLSAPTADQVAAPGAILTLGAVTWA